MPRMSGIFAFFFRDIQVLEDRIDHRVAGHADFIILNTFVQEMLPRSPGRGEEQVRDRIREHPVDLFGHRPVETYEACLHMTDPNGELRRHKRTGKHRVRIALDKHNVRLFLHEHMSDPG